MASLVKLCLRSSRQIWKQTLDMRTEVYKISNSTRSQRMVLNRGYSQSQDETSEKISEKTHDITLSDNCVKVCTINVFAIAVITVA